METADEAKSSKVNGNHEEKVSNTDAGEETIWKDVPDEPVKTVSQKTAKRAPHIGVTSVPHRGGARPKAARKTPQNAAVQKTAKSGSKNIKFSKNSTTNVTAGKLVAQGSQNRVSKGSNSKRISKQNAADEEDKANQALFQTLIEEGIIGDENTAAKASSSRASQQCTRLETQENVAGAIEKRLQYNAAPGNQSESALNEAQQEYQEFLQSLVNSGISPDEVAMNLGANIEAFGNNMPQKGDRDVPQQVLTRVPQERKMPLAAAAQSEERQVSTELLRDLQDAGLSEEEIGLNLNISPDELQLNFNNEATPSENYEKRSLEANQKVYEVLLEKLRDTGVAEESGIGNVIEDFGKCVPRNDFEDVPHEAAEDMLQKRPKVGSKKATFGGVMGKLFRNSFKKVSKRKSKKDAKDLSEEGIASESHGDQNVAQKQLENRSYLQTLIEAGIPAEEIVENAKEALGCGSVTGQEPIRRIPRASAVDQRQEHQVSEDMLQSLQEAGLSFEEVMLNMNIMPEDLQLNFSTLPQEDVSCLPDDTSAPIQEHETNKPRHDDSRNTLSIIEEVSEDVPRSLHEAGLSSEEIRLNMTTTPKMLQLNSSMFSQEQFSCLTDDTAAPVVDHDADKPRYNDDTDALTSNEEVSEDVPRSLQKSGLSSEEIGLNMTITPEMLQLNSSTLSQEQSSCLSHDITALIDDHDTNKPRHNDDTSTLTYKEKDEHEAIETPTDDIPFMDSSEDEDTNHKVTS